MTLTKEELRTLSNALTYGLLYSNNEEETAEFALTKIKFEGQVVRESNLEVKIDRLRTALLRYGVHDAGCNGEADSCHCRLSNAIEKL